MTERLPVTTPGPATDGGAPRRRAILMMTNGKLAREALNAIYTLRMVGLSHYLLLIALDAEASRVYDAAGVCHLYDLEFCPQVWCDVVWFGSMDNKAIVYFPWLY